ncbi:MAG: hypothetical protein AAGH15_13940 [Myxococcota bacterium]
MRALAFPLAFVLGLLATAAPAAAQGTGRRVDLVRFRPTLDDEGFLGINGSATPGPGNFQLALWTHYHRGLLVAAQDEGGSADVIRHRLGANLVAQVGLGGRFALALDVPLVLTQSEDTLLLRDGGPTIQSSAFGDPRLIARARLLGEPRGKLDQGSDGPGLGLLVAATVPTTDDAAASFASEDQVTVDAQLIGDFHLLGLGVGVMLGYRLRPYARPVGAATLDDELMWGVGLKVPLPWVQGLDARLEVRGHHPTQPFGQLDATEVGGDVGFRYRRRGISIFGTVGTGFTGGVGSPDVRAALGVVWTPERNDADGDGIPDDEDECTQLPEDMDGFEDEDGCEDPDNDMDFIPDADDRCPNEPADEDRDLDEDGCTDP